MRNKHRSRIPLGQRSKKEIDRVNKSQTKRFYNYLRSRVCTCTMACKGTGIAQKAATRYKRTLEKQGKLWEVRKDRCKITGFRAYYITTNPKFLKK